MGLSLAEPPAAASAVPAPFRMRPPGAAPGVVVEGFDARTAPSGEQLRAPKSALREHRIPVVPQRT